MTARWLAGVSFAAVAALGGAAADVFAQVSQAVPPAVGSDRDEGHGPGGLRSPVPSPLGRPQAPDDEAPPEIRPGDIVVSANRLPGEVEAPQKPVTTLDEEDVEAYGASSIADLLTAISPQTGSGRGRGSGMPVILVNGLRIASFRELRDFPPEAIRRVEILPEEVALRYGYPPDQRVVNFILKDHFASRTVEAEATAPDRGGTATEQGQLSMLRINGNNRLNLALKADHTSPLTEATRGVIEPVPVVPAGAQVHVPGDPDPAANRTLVANASDYSANGTWTIGLGKGAGSGSLAVNASASRADSTALSGLTSVLLTAPNGAAALRTLPGAIVRQGRTDTVQAGASLNRPLGHWQLSATVDGSHAVATTRSDTRYDTTGLVADAAAGTLAIAGPLPALADQPRDISRAVNDSVTSLVTLTGHPLRLPGGAVALTVKGGFAWTGLTSSDSRSLHGNTRFRRGDGSLGINLGIPLTSRREDFGSELGDLTLNLSAGLDRLSDFGTLTDWSAGVTWGLTDGLGLQASYIVNQAAPTLTQLGNPLTQIPNVPVFDFRTGQTVLVSTTSGGNPGLLRQEQHDFKLGLNWTLPFFQNSNLIAEYFNNRSNNVSVAFPLLTPAVEAAYGRVTRVNGVITAIDQRPVSLAEQHEVRLRWGVNLAGNLGKELPAASGRFGMMGGGGRGGPPPGGFGGGGPGGGGHGGPRHEGRWNLALYHTLQFTDRVLLAPGTPELDLLNGDAIAANGGVARHALELDSGGFYKGFGLRLSGTWAAPSHVRTAGLPAGSDLRFGSVTRLNLRLFADLGQQQRLIGAAPFLKGARLSLRVNNLLDSRQQVTDGNGSVPLSYQADYLDPLGRVIGLEFRKLF